MEKPWEGEKEGKTMNRHTGENGKLKSEGWGAMSGVSNEERGAEMSR